MRSKGQTRRCLMRNLGSYVLMLFLFGLCMNSPVLRAQNVNDRWNQVQERWHAEQNHHDRDARMLSQLIYADVDVSLQDVPAREALNWLEKQVGTRFQVSYMDGSSADGIVPDTKITLELVDTPAMNVLEKILEQCSAAQKEPCLWQLRWGLVYVGTLDAMGEARLQMIRIYPVADLVTTVPDFDNPPDLNLGGGSGGGSGGGGGGGSGGGSDRPSDYEWDDERKEELMLLIQRMVEPSAWKSNGGDAATMMFQDSNLVIRAPGYIHRQIDGFPYGIPTPENRRVRTIRIAGRHMTVEKSITERVKDDVIGKPASP